MAVRGAYTPAEQAMLAGADQLFDTMVGFDDSKGRLVATEEAMVTMARAVDPWNLLYRKDEYARRSRWKEIIAHPLFLDRLHGGGVGGLPASRDCGHEQKVFIGEDWKFLLPVRRGDVFQVFQRRPELVDVTPPAGPRTFGFTEVNKDFVNQEERVVTQVRVYSERSFVPELPQPSVLPEYAYTMEEFRYLAKTIAEERVRGAAVRFWEDVDVGDRTLPTVLGPTSLVDNVSSHLATPDPLMETTSRDWLLMALDKNIGEEFIPGPFSGLFYQRGGPAGEYWSQRSARAQGKPGVLLFPKLSRFLMCRCVTNWMGDDGWLAGFRWRHLLPTPVGDALIARGQVTSKRRLGATHLVDLTVWAENLRGMIAGVAQMSVALRSKSQEAGRTL